MKYLQILVNFPPEGTPRLGAGAGYNVIFLIFEQNRQPPSGSLREREPTGTHLKFKKPKRGRFPEPNFLRQIVFPDRSRPFPEVPRTPFFTTNHCSRTVPGRSRSPFITTNRQFPLGKWHFSVSEALET